MSHDLNAVFYSHTYHPIQAGSIDGTDTAPHDHAVCRAMLATSTGLYDPTGDTKAQGNPYCTVFVGRLSRDTTEATLQEVMSKYGRIKNLRLVRHIVTGASQGYAFVEYETEKEMRYAYEDAHLIKIDGHQVLVDYNRQLLMPGWIPRRLGGGLGGRKESGQLRFGGRDRPFRKPLRPIPVKELEKLGIPLPGGYMQRFETPPLPKRRSSRSGTKTSQDENAHRSPEKDLRRVSSQEARCHEDDDRMRHDEKRWAHYEEEDDKPYHKRDSYKEERCRDHTGHRDYDDKLELHERKTFHEEESRRSLYEEEGGNYDRRPFHRDHIGKHVKRSHQDEDEDYKRRHDDRHEKTHNRGEEDDRRRLDERHKSRDSYGERTSKQHYHEQYDSRSHNKKDSGRSHHHDSHGKKKQDDRRHHYENKEDGDEDREVKDGNNTRRHKRKYLPGAEKTLSDSFGSETEARSKARKVHRRDGDDNETLENRWKP